MTPTQKELQFRMTFSADPSAGVNALRQIGTEARSAEQAVHRLGTVLRAPGGTTPGQGGPFATPAGGGAGIIGGPTGARLGTAGMAAAPEGGGAGAGMAGMLGRFAGPLAAILAAGRTVAAISNSASSHFTTNAQVERQLFKDVVPFGETIQRTVDNFSGRTADMELAGVRSQQRAAAASGRVDLAGTLASLNPQLAGDAARARLLGSASPILEGHTDRTTTAGEAAFRDKQRLLPLQREGAKAEREAAVAAQQSAAATGELVKVSSRVRDLDRERLKLNIQLDRHGGGVERQRVLYRLGEVDNEIQGMTGVERQARMAKADAERNAAAARQQAGMMQVRILQSDAGDLEDKASTAAGTAQRLGGMNRFRRMNAVDALERLKKFGPDNLSEAEIAMAQSVAPREVGKILENAGRNTAEAGRLRALAPEDFAGDPEDLRRKAGEKRDEAVRKELDLEREFASTVQAAGKDLGQFLGDVIRQLIDSTKREIEIRLKQGKNSA